jgi:hypothetical protein
VTRPWTPLAAAWIIVQLAVPLARVDPRAPVPCASRFSWSMFAGRPIARCAHALVWRDRGGRELAGPPPPPGAVGAVLEARSERDFARVVPLLTAYAANDDEVIAALHDLLRRHRRAVDPAARLTLESALRCRTWRGEVIHRTLRLEAR